jgi:hypothetical protein
MTNAYIIAAALRPSAIYRRRADPGELVVCCLARHHNTTMLVAALLSRYAAETPFPEAQGGFRCSACGSRSGWTFGPIGRPARRQDRSPRRSAAKYPRQGNLRPAGVFSQDHGSPAERQVFGLQ